MSHRARAASRRRGYTLIEAIIVVALIGVVSVVVLPSLPQIIVREQTRSFARSTEAFVNFARLRAVRGGRPVHVLLETIPAPPGQDKVEDFLKAMIDTDEDGTGDTLVNQIPIPKTIQLGAPLGLPVIDGFEVLVGTASNPKVTRIVFNTDGSVQNTGAFRYVDQRDNYLELAVGPTRAIGRVVIRKWDGAAYWAEGDGPHDWKWQ